MEEYHDFLFIARPVLGCPDDQRCCKQALLLQRVSVHPMGATSADREVVVPAVFGHE